MAATEEKVEFKVIKAEVKPEAANKETPSVAVQEENPEPSLKCKIWNLKVSVHCEGCKKKVKKILHDIEGVYKVDVDLRQQKATVMGNVDGETLVKKLIKKTGKHAELLPDKADQKDNNKKKKKKKKKKSKNKDNEKQSEDQESSEEGDDCKPEKERESPLKAGVFIIQDPSKNNAQVSFAGKTGHDCVGNVVKVGEVGGRTGGGVVQIREVLKNEVKPLVIFPPGSQSPVADQNNVVGSEKTAANGSGSGGKKMKKGGHNGNNFSGEEGVHSGNAPAGSGSPLSHGQGFFSSPYPTNHSPPRQQIHHFPPHYYPQSPYPVPSPRRHEQTIYYHPPAVAVSHSMVYPSASYGGSYHAPRYEYAYMHPSPERKPSPSDPYIYSSHPSDSFEFLSDENPNACSII